MRPTSAATALLVSLLLGLVPVAASGGPTSETATYVAGHVRTCNLADAPFRAIQHTTGTLTEALPHHGPTDFEGPAAGCFALDGAATEVRIRVDDATGSAVEFSWQYVNEEDDLDAGGVACGATGPLPIPAGAYRLEVYVHPVELDGACGGAMPALGTTGTITATFA